MISRRSNKKLTQLLMSPGGFEMTQGFTTPLTSRVKGGLFNPLEFNPYLLFDAQTSMLGELEAPTLDLDASDESTLDVITATRAGVATYTDLHGTIQTASADTVRVDYVQGEELTPTKYQRIGYTDFSSGWNIGGGGTLLETGTANGETYVQVEHSSGSYMAYYTGVPISSPIRHTVSFYARLVSVSDYQNLYLHVNYSDTINTSITLTEEWQRFTVDVLPNSSSVNFGLMSFKSGVVVEIAMPQVEEGTSATDFVPNTTGSPKFIASATYGPRVPMMLIEPSSENLWGWSEGTISDYSTNAVLYGEGYLSDDTTSRNGLSNWIHFAPSSDTVVGFRIPVSVASGPTMILSFYVIMDDGSKPRVGTSSTGSDTDFAILLQGSSSAGVYGGVEHIGGDLYRVWAYRRFTATSNGQYIYRYGPHSGKGFKVSGVMLEESSLPTSYIPTSGSAVTRNADNLVIDGTAFSDFYNATEGTFYVELQSKAETNTQPHYIDVTDSAFINRITLYVSGVNRLFVNTNGTVVVNNLGIGNYTQNELQRIAASYKVNNFKGSTNGSAEATDTSGNVPVNQNKLFLGQRFNTTYNLNGHIKRLIYWPTHSDNL